MPQEIERKFLVRDDGWRSAVQKSERIEQGYLAATDTMAIRVRLIGEDKAVITVKIATDTAIQRSEYEYPIPLSDARELMEATGTRRIIKRRSTLHYAGKEWVVDEFEGKHQGLVLAEIELEDAAEQVELPPWLGDEVTDKRAFTNSVLAAKAG